MGSDLGEDRITRVVLALAISLSEVVKDALKLQTLDRMKQDGLREEDIERWRGILMDLDAALDQLKGSDGVSSVIHQLRDGVDTLVDHILSTALHSDSYFNKIEIYRDLGGEAGEVRTPNR